MLTLKSPSSSYSAHSLSLRSIDSKSVPVRPTDFAWKSTPSDNGSCNVHCDSSIHVTECTAYKSGSRVGCQLSSKLFLSPKGIHVMYQYLIKLLTHFFNHQIKVASKCKSR